MFSAATYEVDRYIAEGPDTIHDGAQASPWAHPVLERPLDALVVAEIQSPIWADRVRAELTRTKAGSSARASQLTPSEQRVAELAARGMSNREIAAALFITAKTVDVNLYRVYRKLNIQSRTQLAGRLAPRPV